MRKGDSRRSEGRLSPELRYEQLPIYKTAMDLAVYLEQMVRNFSRYHKYTLGSDLRQQSRELVTVAVRHLFPL